MVACTVLPHDFFQKSRYLIVIPRNAPCSMSECQCRNCCFLKIVHTRVASSVDTPHFNFSFVGTLILNKINGVVCLFSWVVKFVA